MNTAVSAYARPWNMGAADLQPATTTAAEKNASVKNDAGSTASAASGSGDSIEISEEARTLENLLNNLKKSDSTADTGAAPKKSASGSASAEDLQQRMVDTMFGVMQANLKSSLEAAQRSKEQREALDAQQELRQDEMEDLAERTAGNATASTTEATMPETVVGNDGVTLTPDQEPSAMPDTPQTIPAQKVQPRTDAPDSKGTRAYAHSAPAAATNAIYSQKV